MLPFKPISVKFGLWLFIVVLLCFFLLNWLSGNAEGSYMNHWPLIQDLWKKPTTIKTPNTSKKHASSRGELECRRVAEKLTGVPFPKSRPPFLYNTVSGYGLELDCYNHDLKLAIEYNGEQHYKYIPYFHSSRDAFLNMRYRDTMKKQLCRDHGIHLIVVPYSVKEHDIESFLGPKIMQALEKC